MSNITKRDFIKILPAAVPVTLLSGVTGSLMKKIFTLLILFTFTTANAGNQERQDNFALFDSLYFVNGTLTFISLDAVGDTSAGDPLILRGASWNPSGGTTPVTLNISSNLVRAIMDQNSGYQISLDNEPITINGPNEKQTTFPKTVRTHPDYGLNRMLITSEDSVISVSDDPFPLLIPALYVLGTFATLCLVSNVVNANTCDGRREFKTLLGARNVLSCESTCE